MAAAVGTVAVVEELVSTPPANRTSPTSAAAGEIPVMDPASVESVSFSLGKIETDVGATWFR